MIISHSREEAEAAGNWLLFQDPNRAGWAEADPSLLPWLSPTCPLMTMFKRDWKGKNGLIKEYFKKNDVLN